MTDKDKIGVLMKEAVFYVPIPCKCIHVSSSHANLLEQMAAVSLF